MGKKILFYFASNSVWYKELYKSVKKGFEEAGCEVIGQDTLLEPEELIKQIDRHKPDFVFEHNRVKSEIPNFPKGVIHICWLVDFWGREPKSLAGSDILYVWAEDWVNRFKDIGFDNVYYLAPATDKDIYKPLNIDKKYRFTFVGHISKLWLEKELNRVVGTYQYKIMVFQKLLPYIKQYVRSKETDKPFLETLKDSGIKLNEPINSTLLYDISSRTFRQTRREDTLDYILEYYDDLVIYGSNNWKLYNKYKKYYKGYIGDPLELSRKIQEAKIMIHDGNFPHFRIFDAMASGVVVCAITPPLNYGNTWDNIGFKDKEDYLSLEIFEHTTDMSIFEDEELLDNISQNGREKVLNNHLWVHRAQQVLNDIQKRSNNFMKE